MEYIVVIIIVLSVSLSANSFPQQDKPKTSDDAKTKQAQNVASGFKVLALQEGNDYNKQETKLSGNNKAKQETNIQSLTDNHGNVETVVGSETLQKPKFITYAEIHTPRSETGSRESEKTSRNQQSSKQQQQYNSFSSYPSQKQQIDKPDSNYQRWGLQKGQEVQENPLDVFPHSVWSQRKPTGDPFFDDSYPYSPYAKKQRQQQRTSYIDQLLADIDKSMPENGDPFFRKSTDYDPFRISSTKYDAKYDRNHYNGLKNPPNGNQFPADNHGQPGSHDFWSGNGADVVTDPNAFNDVFPSTNDGQQNSQDTMKNIATLPTNPASMDFGDQNGRNDDFPKKNPSSDYYMGSGNQNSINNERPHSGDYHTIPGDIKPSGVDRSSSSSEDSDESNEDQHKNNKEPPPGHASTEGGKKSKSDPFNTNGRPNLKVDDNQPTKGNLQIQPTNGNLQKTQTNGGTSQSQPLAKSANGDQQNQLTNVNSQNQTKKGNTQSQKMNENTGQSQLANKEPRIPSKNGDLQNKPTNGENPQNQPTKVNSQDQPSKANPQSQTTDGNPPSQPTNGNPQSQPTNENPPSQPTNENPQSHTTNENPPSQPTNEIPQSHPTNENPPSQPTNENPQDRPTNDEPQNQQNSKTENKLNPVQIVSNFLNDYIITPVSNLFSG